MSEHPSLAERFLRALGSDGQPGSQFFAAVHAAKASDRGDHFELHAKAPADAAALRARQEWLDLRSQEVGRRAPVVVTEP